jgi:hypothetical protein
MTYICFETILPYHHMADAVVFFAFIKNNNTGRHGLMFPFPEYYRCSQTTLFIISQKYENFHSI